MLKEIVRDEVRAVAADGDLEEAVLPSALVRCRGDGVRTGELAVADLQAEVDVLTALEGRDVAVFTGEAEGLRGGRRIRDGDDFDLHGRRVQEIRQFTDGVSAVLVVDDSRSVFPFGLTGIDDAVDSLDVFQESLDVGTEAHFAAPFLARSSWMALAAACPLVMAGPMPSPEMACAPANARPSMKSSAPGICFRATAWSSMEWE